MTIDDIDLRRLQEILHRLIVTPSGVAAGLAHETTLSAGDLDKLIAGDDRMSAIERVEVYANGYFYRILEVLKEDFPATLLVAGADNFHNLATGYLIDYPPTEPSIYYAGQNFAAFIAAHPLRERWPFLADLARLERTTLESFHAGEAPALDAATMRALAPALWPALGLRAHPATRLVDSAWRIDEVLRAVEDGGAWHGPRREPVTILVTRREARVEYRPLEHCERAAMRLASEAHGATFAAICEAIAADANPGDDVAAIINRLLARWLTDGVFMRPAV